MKVVYCENCGKNIKCTTDHGFTLKDCKHCVAEFYLACKDKNNPKERTAGMCDDCTNKEKEKREETNDKGEMS